MSRVTRYQDSVKRFINNRSCFVDVKGSDLEDIIKEHTGENKYLLSILFLTIMNKQTKKNKLSFQGYYSASCLEFIRIYTELILNKDKYCEKYGLDKYSRSVNLLIILSTKSWNQNMEVAKKCLNNEQLVKLYSQFTNLFNDKLGIDKILGNNKLIENKKIKSDLHRHNIKFSKTKQYNKESFDLYIENTYGSLCELVVILGWLIGCDNNTKNFNRLIKAGKAFGYMYKLSQDFGLIDDNNDKNYVINCGIQESYECFLHNKQKFIEETMNLDIFSNTIKEIINNLEYNVNKVIDKTKPDLKSNYSTIL